MTEFIDEQLFIVILYLIFGLLFGSFVTMASYRMPRNENIVIKPSHCTTCNHNLSFLDLFPLFSWLFSKGKCRYCKNKISLRYPLTEVLLSVTFLIIHFNAASFAHSIILCIFAVFMAIMIIVDLEHKIIPDEIQIASSIIALVYAYINNNSPYYVISGGLFGIIFAISLRYGFYLWKKKEGLGMGDVKFFAIIGMFLGIKSFMACLFMSGIIGIATSFIWKFVKKDNEFPFGPALAISLFICLIFPKYISLFYLKF